MRDRSIRDQLPCVVGVLEVQVEAYERRAAQNKRLHAIVPDIRTDEVHLLEARASFGERHETVVRDVKAAVRCNRAHVMAEITEGHQMEVLGAVPASSAFQ
jgi:hypothetical protein